MNWYEVRKLILKYKWYENCWFGWCNRFKWCSKFKYSKYNLSWKKSADSDFKGDKKNKTKNVVDATTTTDVMNRQSSDLR